MAKGFYQSRLCLIHNKGISACRKPDELLRSGLLEDVFGVKIHDVDNGRAYWFERIR